MQNGTQNPFLGLKPYERKDREKLYGRDKDLILMKDRIFSARTTLLFAGSGVGKTSFLNAKIVPELHRQYRVVYHNRWAGTDDPLVSVKNSLMEQLADGAGVQPTPSPGATGYQSLLDHLHRFNRNSPESPTGNLANRCLLILDQFEEIFQYHAYEQYFGKFVEELSAVINAADNNTRVLFSMREEFLGELSVFDNHIPDLFNNYYRLKCPNKIEAEEIIERTCELASVPVDNTKLKILIGDLAKIERGEAGVVERSKVEDVKPVVLERDFVIPPYLQIACQRLWETQFGNGHPTEAQTFLSAYEVGDARKMLNIFCQEKLSSLNDKERAVLANAFDFLVTKKGAKIAYELSSLAEHTEVDENVLKSVLLKLSSPDSRILRASSGPDGSLWFELYHDMYGSIVDEWKRTYRLNKKLALQRRVKRAALGVGSLLLILGCFLALRYWYFQPRQYQKTLRENSLRSPSQYREALRAFNNLKDTLGFERKAKELWAAAWERRAHLAESDENREEALLSWLKVAVEGPSGPSAAVGSQVARYLKDTDYRSLLVTYQNMGMSDSMGDTDPIFSADGQTLSMISNDLVIHQWDTYTGEPLKQSPPLQLPVQFDIPRKNFQRPEQRGTEVPATGLTSSRVPSILATVKHPFYGYLIAGYMKNGFSIWRADTGALIWSSPQDTKEERTGSSSALDSSMDFSRDGQYVAITHKNQHAQIYRLTAGNDVVKPILQPIDSLIDLEFSPDNNTLLILRNGGLTLELWDLKMGTRRAVKGLSQVMRSASFSPDGTRFLLVGRTAFDDFQIWDTASVSPINSPNKTLPNDRLYPQRLLADNKTVVVFASSLRDSRLASVVLLNGETGARISDSIDTFADFRKRVVNPDGRSLLTISRDNRMRLWNTSALPERGKTLKGSDFSTYRLSADGHILATLNYVKEVKVWNTDDLTQIGQSLISSNNSPRSVPGSNYPYWADPDLDLSPDGQYVAVQDSTNVVTVWDINTRHETPLVHPKKVTIGVLKFSPTGDILATASTDKIVRLWKNLRSQTPEVVNWQPHEFVTRLVFSPDGKYLAAVNNRPPYYSGSDSYVRVIEVATGKEISNVSDQDIVQNILVLGRNGQMITGSKDNTALLWDLATGNYFGLPLPALITTAAFSSDSKMALTGCNDGTVRLWDVESGTMLGNPENHGKNIRFVALTRDGTTAISVTDEWIHLSSLSNSELKYETSCPNSDLREAYYVRALDQSGKRFRILLRPFTNMLRFEDISFDAAPDSGMQDAKSDALLEEWLNKLSVKFDEQGQIVPKWDERFSSD